MIGENNEDAYNIMIDKYQPVIDKFAKKYIDSYPGIKLDKDELIQEGNIGLINAISNYTEDKNCLFYSFALLIIQREMKRYINTCLTNKNLILLTADSLNVEIGEDLTLQDVLYKEKDSVEDKVIDTYYEDLLYKFKNELTINESCVYELKFNNFSTKEISSLLDLKYKAVDNYLRSIKNKLSIYLKNKI